jgi:MipA family protein
MFGIKKRELSVATTLMGPAFAATFLALAGWWHPTMAIAADAAAAPATGWSGSVGIAVAYAPSYAGSPNERAFVAPPISVSYRDSVLGTFALGLEGLSWTFLDDKSVRLGVLVGFDSGRESRTRGPDLFRFGDDRLSGMGDVEASAEAGVMAGYGPITLIARKAIGDRGHAGFIADLSFDWACPLSDKIGLSAGVGTRWADQKYQQAYFGVTQAQAAASRFQSYTPEEGFVNGNVNIGLAYRFAAAWSAHVRINYEHLIEQSKASPLAEKPNSVTGYVGLSRHFE